MIKLSNVNKTYVSKSKQKVEAIKDINLEIADSGMVFILGKSGSGKSTLLNILGGIDSATSGEIFVDDISLANYKDIDFDSYRNQYVSFVFQEFNLLSDFNVKDNVAIALQLNKESNVTEKVTKALEEVELSANYLTRKIDELSGGEKQRIAIARAFVKDSQMILADEPTGNLDSGTGESIWKLLKNFSKSKLVVVVTHDRESAEKYADRIIEIADGKIFADNGSQPAITEEKKKYEPKKQSLSAKVVFKMGVNNLLQRKVKAVSVILLAIFTIFTLLLMQLTLTFSAEKTFAKFIADNNIDYIEVMQGKLRYGNEFNSGYVTKNSTLQYITNNSACIQNNIIESKNDVLNMGLSFVGEALEIDDNSFYLTISGLEKAYNSQYSYVIVDGEKVKLIKEKHPIEFIVGKKLKIFYSDTYTLAGVIDTTKSNKLVENIFSDYYANKNFKENITISLMQNSGSIPEISMQFGQKKYSDKFKCENDISELVYNSENSKILTSKGLQFANDIVLADDEIVLTYEMYSRLFSVSPKWSYVNVDLTQVVSMPQHIGKSFDLKFCDYETNELFLDVGTFKIAGIAFNLFENKEDEEMLQFSGSKNTNKKINTALDKSFKIVVQIASIDNLKKFLTNFRSEYDGFISSAGRDDSNDYATSIYTFEHELYLFKFIFATVAVIMTIVLLLFVINLISFSIANRKKEIGILSAIGASRKDLTKIFIIETAIISTITFVVNTIAIIVAKIIFNKILSAGNIISVPFLRIDIFTIIFLAVASYVFLLLAALIPIRKIIKLKPIDAIKNL